MKISCRVENIFCRIDLKQEIDLDERKSLLAGMKTAKNFGAYVYDHPRLNVKMMIFPSGEVHMSGAKSNQEIESSFWALKAKLKEIGVRLDLQKEMDIVVENVLATGNVRDYLPETRIDLEKLALNENAVYDPEKSPAAFLSFFLKGRQATAMVFRSGKVLIGDVGSLEDANLVMGKVIETVRKQR
jgi:TATA-box binding protein (TBP) (component of TFIID and TFIIIB)